MPVRGIRGAVSVPQNTAALILEAASGLLTRIIADNAVSSQDIACVFFSATPDLDACFPAAAARNIGLTEVPLFGSCELNPPGSVPRCVRVLMLVNTDKSQGEMKHIYLGEASALRPDWA